MHTGRRERATLCTRAFARAETWRGTRLLSHSAAAQIRAACTTRKMTGRRWCRAVFELGSTRKYFTPANTRRDGSYRNLFLSLSFTRALVRPPARSEPRGFSSSSRYVIRQTSKRFRVARATPGGLQFGIRLLLFLRTVRIFCCFGEASAPKDHRRSVSEKKKRGKNDTRDVTSLTCRTTF